MGIFYGISVGPGDPELLSLKAIHTLENLDILYAPQGKRGEPSFALRIAGTYIPDRVEVRQRHFPMSYDLDFRNQVIEEIALEIYEQVLEGKKVGFITLGDSMVYSTYQYLLAQLEGKIPTQTIAGIPSFVQIASELEKALTIGEEILTVLPATASAQQIEKALILSDTIVIMKVSSYMDKIKPLILKYHLEENVYVVSHASLEKMLTYKSLEAFEQDHYSYYTTMIIYKNRGSHE